MDLPNVGRIRDGSRYSALRLVKLPQYVVGGWVNGFAAPRAGRATAGSVPCWARWGDAGPHRAEPRDVVLA